ncbi:MAG TPA: TIGR04104 family putative zinc finger protein [Bacillota bacterium]|nr:TIGR04104 family putative zinc finger protein [Bacillota bacterium]
MPVCTNCHKKWSWKQTVKKTNSLYPKMTCPLCGAAQYHSRKSLRRGAFLNLMILLPLLIQLFFDVPGIILLSLFPVLALIVYILHPFTTELSSKEAFPLR